MNLVTVTFKIAFYSPENGHAEQQRASISNRRNWPPGNDPASVNRHAMESVGFSAVHIGQTALRGLW